MIAKCVGKQTKEWISVENILKAESVAPKFMYKQLT